MAHIWEYLPTQPPENGLHYNYLISYSIKKEGLQSLSITSTVASTLPLK